MKKKFKIPHSFIIIGSLLIFLCILSYIIPAGEYRRVFDEQAAQEVIVPGSYKTIANNPVTFFGMFKAIAQGMVDASPIIFFVFFAYGFVHMLVVSGALFRGVFSLRKTLKKQNYLFLPICMLLFGICGSTFGLYEEVYGLLPAFMGIAIALGYDALTGGAAVVLGVVTGFSAATLNPFTVGIAKEIAGLPLYEGLPFRIICFILFEGIVIIYLMRYATMVKKNPEKSIVKGINFSVDLNEANIDVENSTLETKHKLIILVFAITIGVMIYGTTSYGWYLEELSALFIIATFVLGFIAGYSPSEICEHFIDSSKDIIFGALIIGIARSLVIVMDESKIIDTLVYYLANHLEGKSPTISALGMLVAQNILNFFVPSGSGQAAISMPIMSNISDAVGLNREIAIFAYQFGDGFSNLFWPTVIATECGIMGISLDRWYKFMAPLFLILLIVQALLLVVAVNFIF